MTTLKRALAMTLAAALAGVVGLAFYSRSKEKPVPASVDAVRTISAAELSQVASVNVLFGHQSVGRNILDGVAAVYAANRVAAPAITEVDEASASRPSGIIHAAIGKNGDPLGKMVAFDSLLRSGAATGTDVALMKFCYVDIRWDTDVDALFAEYVRTFDALERDFPDLLLIHVTAPLTTGPGDFKEQVKVLIGRNDNVARERYNDLLRRHYGAGRVFDLAAIEGTAPDGTRSGTLYQGYSSDGAHLNPTGGTAAASGLLRLLAANLAS